MLTPAPIEAASPTKNAFEGLCVSPAAAKSGPRVETEPSISPSKAGWTFWRTKSESWVPRRAKRGLRLIMILVPNG